MLARAPPVRVSFPPPPSIRSRSETDSAFETFTCAPRPVTCATVPLAAAAMLSSPAVPCTVTVSVGGVAGRRDAEIDLDGS